jgi:hypothetical protein
LPSWETHDGNRPCNIPNSDASQQIPPSVTSLVTQATAESRRGSRTAWKNI